MRWEADRSIVHAIGAERRHPRYGPHTCRARARRYYEVSLVLLSLAELLAAEWAEVA